MKIKTFVMLFLVICIFMFPVGSYAAEQNKEQNRSISIEEAYSQAIKVNYNFTINDRNLYNLLHKFGAPEIIHDRNPLNIESEFNKLYLKLKSGQFLQSYEQGELVMYYAVFKDSKVFEGKSMSPILPNDFPNCDIWISMMQLKINNELLRQQIIDSVSQQYDSLLLLNDNISSLEDEMKILKSESEEADRNYKNGKISELDRKKINNNYEIQKLELSKEKRNKENIVRSLKSALGWDQKENFKVAPYNILDKDIAIPDYNTCIGKALINRHEITIQKMNLLAMQNRLPVIENYIWYLPNDEQLKMQREEILLSIDEINDEITTQEEFVIKDINSRFAEVGNKNKSLDIAKTNYSNAQEQLKKADIQFKSGEISVNAYRRVQIDCKRTKVNYDSTLRELAYQVRMLNLACGV